VIQKSKPNLRPECCQQEKKLGGGPQTENITVNLPSKKFIIWLDFL
jgi:hypothetical protein